MRSKLPKLFGCAACPWADHKEQRFVAPEIPENPNLIAILETPEKPPLLQVIWNRYKIRPIILAAANCCNREDPDTGVIKACRDAYVRPILSQYPKLPVVGYGVVAATSLFGGTRKLQSLIYKPQWINNRLVMVTYHQDTYGQTHDTHVLQHIEITTSCAISLPKQYQSFDKEPTDQDLAFLFSQKELILDVETENPPPDIPEPGQKPKKQPKLIYPWVGGKLSWIGLRAGGVSYTWKVQDHYDSPLMEALKSLFRTYQGTIVGHNVKGDMVFLGYYGIRAPKAKLRDTMIWCKSQPVWPTTSVGLKWLAKRDHEADAYEAEVHSLWDQKVPTSQIAYEKMRNYLAGDLWYTDLLDQQQHPGPQTFAFRLASDYLPVITDMELNGFHVDVETVREEIVKNKAEQATIRAEIDLLAKALGAETFNPQSPQQIKKLMASAGIELGSTDEEAIDKNAHLHPILAKIGKLRKVAKRKSTYWDTFLKWATYPAGDGGVHSQHGVQGTEGGRLNSWNPNMQNPPVDVRHCFISRYPGGKLLDPDLAALEYRLIAHASQDDVLCGMFRRKGFSTTKDKDDIHIASAMNVYELSVTDALARRDDGKTVNYMGVYGGGYEKFLETSGLLDSPETQATFRKIKNLYPKVELWKQNLIQRLHQTGRVVNMFGRIREFDEEITPNIEREAVNWAIQSAGHDILIIFILELLDRFAAAGLDWILLVAELHDEPVFDAPADQWELGAKIVEEVGLQLNSLILDSFGVDISVPIFAECKVLERWK